jgi:hypothetical protein
MYDQGFADESDESLDLCLNQLLEASGASDTRYCQEIAPSLAPFVHAALALRELGTLQLTPAAKQAGRQALRQALRAQQRER